MIIDIVVVVVLFLSSLIAFIRGFVREVLTIAGVVGGLAAAYFGGDLLIPVMRGWFGLDPDAENVEKLFGIIPYTYVADGLSYFSIFLVVVIVISIISHFLSEGLKNIGLGAIDRTFGVIFGLLRGVLLLGLFYLPFHLSKAPGDDYEFMKESRTGMYIEQASKFLMNFVPQGAKEALQESAEQAEGVMNTKDKLEQMNLLKKDGEPTRSDIPEGNDGYKDGFRDDMNQLFERQQDQEGFKELREQKDYNE